MQNPATSIWGIVLIIGAVLILAAHAIPPLLKGDIAGAMAGFQQTWPAVAAAIAGLGLLKAKDGSV